MHENKLNTIARSSLIYKNNSHYGVYVALVGMSNVSLNPNGNMLNENASFYYYLLSYIKKKDLFYDSNYETGEILTKEYETDKKMLKELERAFLYIDIQRAYDIFYVSYVENRGHDKTFKYKKELSYGVDYDESEIVYETITKCFAETNSDDKAEIKRYMKNISEFNEGLKASDKYLYAVLDYKTLINDWLNNRSRIVKTHFINVITKERIQKESILHNKELKISINSILFNDIVDEIAVNDNTYCVEVPIPEGETPKLKINCDEKNCEICLSKGRRTKVTFTEFECRDFYGENDRATWLCTRLVMTKETVEWLRNRLLGITDDGLVPCRIINKDSLDSCVIGELRLKTTDNRFDFFSLNNIPCGDNTIRFISEKQMQRFKKDGTLDLFTKKMLQKKQKEYVKNCLMGRRMVDFITIIVDDYLNVKDVTFRYTDKTDLNFGGFEPITNIKYLRESK